MLQTQIIIILLIAYLIGSIPFGLIIGKFKNIDIRTQGSGNIGATNVARIVGKKLGILTLLLDGLKGAIAILVAKYFNLPENIILAIGVFSVIGHVFPLWLKFKGGKGVATSIAVIMVCNYKIGLLLCAAFLTVFMITKIVSLASIISFAIISLYSYLFEPKEMFFFTLIISFIVIIRHHSNILRIYKGTEKQFK